MTNTFTRTILLGLCVGASFWSAAAENSLDALQGKWSVTKTNQEGQRYTQTLEIKKDQLSFKIAGQEERTFFATGTLKLEKLGPFDVMKVTNIKAGRSADELAEVDDERASLYTLRDGKWFIASNFDKERENQRPNVDAYSRAEVKQEGASAGSEGESKLLGKWKVEVKYGDNDPLDYDLRIGKAEGKLEATLISPRSGEHKFKSVSYKQDELVMEVDREMQGNQAMFIYKGKLDDNRLAGTVTVKGFEDQFKGTWKASK